MNHGADFALGIDVIEPDAEDVLKRNWTFLIADLNRSWLNQVHEKFDLIMTFDILEHLDSPYQFLSSCFSLLKDGGYLILTTPNLMSLERFINPRQWSGVRDPQRKVLFQNIVLIFY